MLLEPAGMPCSHAASAAATGSDGAPATAEADGGIDDIGPPPSPAKCHGLAAADHASGTQANAHA